MPKYGKYRRIRRAGGSPPLPLRWSDTATWGGPLPGAGDNVTVPVGATYLLDVDTASLGALTINGTLQIDPIVAAVTLTAQGIYIAATGKLKCGSAITPHPGTVTVELTGTRQAGTIIGPTHNISNVSASNPSDSFLGIPGLSRGIVNEGGEIEIYCATPAVTRTQLNASAAAAATSLTVADALAWPNAADVLIGPTGFFDNQHAETFTLNGAVAGTTVVLSAGLAAARYGVMQYLTDSGIATSAGTFSAMRGNASQRSTLDQRAKVALLKRNFVIRAPNDAEWTGKRFGVHIMTMGLASKMIMEGVQVLRCGQGGLLGRYPIHWHMLSYNSTTGANLGNADATRHRVKNCVVWQSQNRGVTVHGTRGVEVLNNVCHDIKGQALFLEDGSEEDNRIEGNWVGYVRDPNTGSTTDAFTVTVANPGIFTKTAHGFENGQNVIVAGSPIPGGFNAYDPDFSNAYSYWVVNAAANTFQLASTPGGTGIQATSTGTSVTVQKNWRLKIHDRTPATFWVTNPNNQIQFNAGYDADFAYWNAFSYDRTGYPGGCFGLSSQVALHPFFTPPKKSAGGSPLYNDNEGHCCRVYGAQTNFAVIDEQGTTRDTSAPAGSSDINGPRFKSPANSSGADVLGVFGRFYLWKNQQAGYQNRVVNPHYADWVMADNPGPQFFGATLEATGSKITAPVLIKTSLNTEAAPASGSTLNNGFASYHTSLTFTDVAAFGFALTTPTVAGVVMPHSTYLLPMADAVLQTWDLYTRPVFMGFGVSSNWKLYNSEAWYQTPSALIINDAWDTWTGNQPMDTGGFTRRWNLGCIYDHNNISGYGAALYHIHDHPFYTTGLSASTALASPRMTRTTPDTMIGLYPHGDDTQQSSSVQYDNAYYTPFTVSRLDSALAAIAGASITFPDGSVSTAFNGMRHCHFPSGAYVKFNRTSRGVQSQFIYHTVYNCSRRNGVDGQTRDDFFYLVDDWSGSVVPRVFASVGLNGSNDFNADWDDAGLGARAFTYSSVASLALLQSSGGRTYWHDTANNRIVIKVAAHATTFMTAATRPYTSDEREFALVIKPGP